MKLPSCHMERTIFTMLYSHITISFEHILNTGSMCGIIVVLLLLGLHIYFKSYLIESNKYSQAFDKEIIAKTNKGQN